ncbi:MAG: hypothetical protein A2Y17_03695 [Clostridiales bacterium GWF2_38_85]|nr:MAG: hypothetical protein A2Y17_03695 [Clostridiales bacterium GWF2_38_85]
MNQSINKTVEQIAAVLKQSEKPFLILTHTHPDADTLGSASALAQILKKCGKKAKVLTGNVPARYMFLDKNKVFVKESKEDCFIISVDIASPKLLGDFETEYSDKINLTIDHHMGNNIECEYKLLMSDRVACGEIIYELMIALGVDLDSEIAEALYAAIVSDSGGFKYSSVRPQTHIIAAQLIEQRIDFAEINRLLFDMKTKEQFTISKLAYTLLEFFSDEKIALIGFNDEMLKEHNIVETEFSDVAQLPRQLEGVEVGILIRPDSNGGYKLSLRSNKFVNVAEICNIFGGGGHYHAAGCNISGSLEDVKSVIVKEVEKRF